MENVIIGLSQYLFDIISYIWIVEFHSSHYRRVDSDIELLTKELYPNWERKVVEIDSTNRRY